MLSLSVAMAQINVSNCGMLQLQGNAGLGIAAQHAMS
jgi:hypothetical protein